MCTYGGPRSCRSRALAQARIRFVFRDPNYRRGLMRKYRRRERGGCAPSNRLGSRTEAGGFVMHGQPNVVRSLRRYQRLRSETGRLLLTAPDSNGRARSSRDAKIEIVGVGSGLVRGAFTRLRSPGGDVSVSNADIQRAACFDPANRRLV